MIIRACKVSKSKQALESNEGKLLQQENSKTKQLNNRYKTGICDILVK